ncbi:MAG TPA: acetolactate synthase large subunit [Gammaproteobacteria bacterium]|nr:acetolactate synthase large subunit [Gammaproteobacteria bacterium]
MKASDLFVTCLEEEGVEFIFGVPGEENLDLIDSLRTSRIRLIVTRHEQHAAFMAAAYGRLTGRAGVCLATLGPGATNLLTGIAHAQLGGMPLVAITGQKAIRDNWQAKFQLVDVVGTFRPLVKWNTAIHAAHTIPRDVRHAFKVAEQERPGAVHLELPEDVAGDSLPETPPHSRVRVRRPVPDGKAIAAAAALIGQARCPLLLISAGANRKRISKQLRAFVEHTGIYAVSTQMGKGVLPDSHRQSLFCLGIHKRDYVHAAVDHADLIITVGYDIVEYPPFVWNEHRRKQILHLDFEPAEPDEFYNPTAELVGDISYSLWALRERLAARASHPAMVALRRHIAEALFDSPCPAGFPPGPRQVVREVRACLGEEDFVSLDNGIYKIWFARLYRAYAENTVLLDNALATMGAGLAGAMTAALLEPARRALAVVGDGGFLMNSQDLETAVRLALEVKILLLRDDAYGFIRWKQAAEGFEDFAMRFGNPDFVAYARAYGATGLRVMPDQGLAACLREAFATPGVVLIDCPIDYTDNALLNEDLRLAVQHLMQDPGQPAQEK